MPQIEQLAGTYSSQIFWLLVFFGLVFFVIGRGMVPRVMGTVERRDRSISDDLLAARNARDAADREEEAWRVRENENRASAQALLSGAKADALRDSERRVADAQGRFDDRIDQAERRIAQSRRDALASVETVAADAAQDIVARIAGIAVEQDAARTAVQEATVHG